MSWRLLGQGKRCLVCLADCGCSVFQSFVTYVFLKYIISLNFVHTDTPSSHMKKTQTNKTKTLLPPVSVRAPGNTLLVYFYGFFPTLLAHEALGSSRWQVILVPVLRCVPNCVEGSLLRTAGTMFSHTPLLQVHRHSGSLHVH